MGNEMLDWKFKVKVEIFWNGLDGELKKIEEGD